MQIQTYKDASEIPEKYLPSLVESQIECWGSKPFDEYMICENSECRTLYSIEDVHGSIEEYRNRVSDIVGFECIECGEKAELMYEKEQFINMFKKYFKSNVVMVLLLDNQYQVEGFGTLSKAILIDLINDVLDSRPNSWSTDDVINIIANQFEYTQNISEKEFICSHQIYVSPGYREGNTSLEVLKKLFSIDDSYKELPIIGETRIDSKFYPISRIMGYEDLLFDKYGGILQFSKDYKKVLDVLLQLNSFSDKSIFSQILKYRREAGKIIKSNPEFSYNKTYK